MSSTKHIDGAAAQVPERDARALAALLGAEREAKRLEGEARELKGTLAARIEEGKAQIRTEADERLRSAAALARQRERERADREIEHLNAEKEEKLKVLRERFSASRESYIERVFGIVTGQADE